MTHDTRGQALIEDLFAALELRHLDTCAQILEELRFVAAEQLRWQPWCEYFAGTLANEHDHDWSRAEQIFAALLATELEDALRGRVLYALGRTYDYQGRWLDAIATFERMLAGGPAIERAKAWKHIAISYRNGFAQGDFGPSALRQASDYCRRALAALADSGEPPAQIAWLTGSIWNTLGAIAMNLAQWDEAIDCYTRDIAICRSLGDEYGIAVSTLNLGEIYHRRSPAGWPAAGAAYLAALAAFHTFDDPYLAADTLANLALLRRDQGDRAAALGYYQQAITAIERLRGDVSGETARAGFFATVADTYANAALLCVELGDLAQAFSIAEHARARAFHDALAARSADLSQRADTATLTLAEAQAALPEDGLLLEYFTTGVLETPSEWPGEGQVAQRHRFPPARTLLFAITRRSAQVFDLQISPNDLRPSTLDGPVERHFLGAAIRQSLYRTLLAPAEPLLAGARRLYLVPHGPLHYIPFGALLASDSAALLRAGGPQLVHGLSATLLLRAPPAQPAYTPALALGYNGEGGSRLHFGENEAHLVAGMLGGAAWAGPAPKVARLYQQAQGYRVLHFSCHGLFDAASPFESALLLAPGERLTALDVLNHLRLRCDLVALSACESGLSRVRRGDELLGLVRAFLFAGAPALICSLWRVDERAACLLMELFYAELRRGAPAPAALQLAQLGLMRLTRGQARDRLIHIAASGLLAEHQPALDEARLRAGWAWPAAPAAAAPPSDDDMIFADAYFWAPFILITRYAA